MSVAPVRYSNAALSLHEYLRAVHCCEHRLVGPDSGVRFEYRIWRFLKSYTAFVPWHDRYAFQQAQAYWVLSNWALYDVLGREEFGELALSGSRAIVAAQEDQGHWVYPPVPSRKGKIATVEGNFAALALSESYRRTGEAAFRASAEGWLQYLSSHVGFRTTDLGRAVNYWADSGDAMVPNNTTLTLWTFAELASALDRPEILDEAPAMVDFLSRVQLGTGELPYRLRADGSDGRPHFLCYQYNAFELLDLAHYQDLTKDDSVGPIIAGIARFLAGGVSENGSVRYDCDSARPEVLYYATAVACALSRATSMGRGRYGDLAAGAFDWVLGHQRRDGGFAFFSRRNYGVLADRRSYPRNLAMMLYHLCLELKGFPSEERTLRGGAPARASREVAT